MKIIYIFIIIIWTCFSLAVGVITKVIISFCEVMELFIKKAVSATLLIVALIFEIGLFIEWLAYQKMSERIWGIIVLLCLILVFRGIYNLVRWFIDLIEDSVFFYIKNILNDFGNKLLKNSEQKLRKMYEFL